MPHYETLQNMEITYKKGVPTIRLKMKGNFPMIFYRILKNLLQRGHGANLVPLTHMVDETKVKNKKMI